MTELLNELHPATLATMIAAVPPAGTDALKLEADVIAEPKSAR